MSYCSKCGVELFNTESSCPLCRTRIASGNGEGSHSAYPSAVEAVPLGNKHNALIGLLVLLAPALICLVIDIASNGSIDWAPYVWGAEVCLFIFAFLPTIFARPKASVCVLTDTVIAGGYLYLIGAMAGSTEWVLPLGLPLLFLTGVLTFGVIKTLQSKTASRLLKSAIILGFAGIFSLAIEILIGLFRIGTVTLGWSVPVLLPIMFIFAVLLVIENNRPLKTKITQLIFY